MDFSINGSMSIVGVDKIENEEKAIEKRGSSKCGSPFFS